MKKTTFLIVGKHAVLEALKNPARKIAIFLAGFFNASKTACFPTIKNVVFFMFFE